MRTLLVTGAVALALTASIAEARPGRGLRGTLHGSPHIVTTLPVRAAEGPKEAPKAEAPARVAEAPRYVSLKPGTTGSIPAPAAAPAAPGKLAQQERPRCAPERLVGTGAGFCLIN